MFNDQLMVDNGVELLTEDACWALLSRAEVGRVGVTVAALPAIFPVNYAVLGRAVVFRTAPGTKLAAATSGEVVAFEVDEFAGADRSGWSVLAVGRAEVVHDLDVTVKVLEAGLEPWADGTRVNVVRVAPTFISGRRLVHD
jgi:nitroimidazol reductase NimA-like FMN-containing flavoprotein (pyridoxamine 5'-phosphate oxidase superfamily)